MSDLPVPEDEQTPDRRLRLFDPWREAQGERRGWHSNNRRCAQTAACVATRHPLPLVPDLAAAHRTRPVDPVSGRVLPKPAEIDPPAQECLETVVRSRKLGFRSRLKIGATIDLRRIMALFWRKKTEGYRMTQTMILPLALGRCIVSGMALPAVAQEAVPPGSGVATPAVPAMTDAEIDALRGLALNTKEAEAPNKLDSLAKEGSARAAPAILRPGFVMSMRGLNPNAYTDPVQARLADKGACKGPLNGLMTTSTIRAIYTVRRERGVESRCAEGPLHPDTARVLSELLN